MQDFSINQPPLSCSSYFLVWQEKGIKIAAILAVSFICYWFLRILARKIIINISQKRLKTILSLFYNAATVFVIFITVLIILDQLGINITPILASAGVIGIAIGFGSQTLVKDIISGLFLLSEDQIRIGDLVKIGAFEGTVERIGIRSIVLRDTSGSLNIIPNSQVTNLINMTRDFSQVNLSIDVSSRHKIDEVLKVIRDVLNQMYQNPQFKEVILAPPEVLGIEELTGSRMSIKILVKTKPKKQFYIAREVRYLLKKTFEEKNFEFA